MREPLAEEKPLAACGETLHGHASRDAQNPARREAPCRVSPEIRTAAPPT